MKLNSAQLLMSLIALYISVSACFLMDVSSSSHGRISTGTRSHIVTRLEMTNKNSSPFGGLMSAFQSKPKNQPSPPTPVISPQCKEAILLYKKSSPRSPESESDLASNFNALSRSLKSDSDEIVLSIVKKFPTVLRVDASNLAATFDVYEGIWGYEKALGVVTRNPALLSVPAQGYGSASTSGEETVILSYIIDATRPVGKFLLAGLFLALLKPFVLQLLEQQ